MLCGTELTDFTGSRIPHATIAAYLATDYCVLGQWPLMLRIGQRSQELAVFYGEFTIGKVAVITAWNPYSDPRADIANREAQERLVGELDRLGLRHEPAHGADPTGQWPPEDSRLVLNIDLALASRLGTQFEQNGIVWAGADTQPLLVLLR